MESERHGSEWRPPRGASGEHLHEKGDIRAVKSGAGPHLRYALNPDKVEKFFLKAQAIGATVTIVTEEGRMEDLKPLTITDGHFAVESEEGELLIEKALVRRIEYIG
jgi:hypothetical protein